MSADSDSEEIVDMSLENKIRSVETFIHEIPYLMHLSLGDILDINIRMPLRSLDVTVPELRRFYMFIYRREPFDCQHFIAPKLETFELYWLYRAKGHDFIENFSIDRYPNLKELEFDIEDQTAVMDGFIHASNPDFEFDFSDIGDFKTLNKLSLCLTYVDYSKISHLKSLEKLYIEDCFNLSRFKNVLMNLKNLRKIIIVDCKFDGFSDDIILENLEDLKLTACSLYKLGGLGGCLNLKSLMAIESKIEEVTTDLSIFLKLENLDLAENNLSTLENIHSVPNLKTLNVEENDFVAIDKPLNYPKLTELIISSNIIKVLDDKNSPLKSLEILKYQCCGLEKISVDFSKFEKLRELSLDSSMNFGAYIVSLKPFTRISSLETLNLSATDLTEIDHQLCGDRLTSLCLLDNDIAELKNLESLVHLKYLEVAHCKLTSIKMNFSCLKNLEELCLHDNNLSSFENINDIPSLIKLNLHKNNLQKIDLPLNYPRLRYLFLFQNKWESLDYVSSLKNLESLNLSGITSR